MAQKPYCCRTRVRTMFTLCVAAGIMLFLINIISQIWDIPPSRSNRLSTGDLARQELIGKWRKERGAKKSAPLMEGVQCKGSQCAKFMGVFGLDESSKGNNGDTMQHCKHPLFLPENDTISDAFYSIPPLNCRKPGWKCGYSSGKIHIAEGYSCMLSSIERLEGDDSGVGYTHDMLIRESSILTQDAKGDNFRLACVTDQKLGKFSGSNHMEQMKSAIKDPAQIDEEHFFTHLSQYPDGKPELTCEEGRCLPYNILILGIGSLSQMSFSRLLPKSHDYFKSTLQSLEFEGYNVVGQGSSGALLPLLTGLDEESQAETRQNHRKSHFVDKLDLLWNQYDNHGYMTLYAEDHPTTNTFNERFQGFEMPPTAHYMRPFWLAAEHSKKSHCLGDKPQHQYMLDYLLQFHSAYAHERRFALAMLKDLTETDVMSARHLDDDLLSFMKNMSSYLDDTIVILMSDHGVLPTKALSSWQSKAEARMPLLSIYLPTSFMRNYSELARVMVANEDKLVTPYDVHMTLKDIIDAGRLTQADPRDEGKFGQSLFKPLPKDRTCEKAGVNVHWCACHTQFKVQPKEVDSGKIGDLVMSELNKLTSAYREKCAAYDKVRLLNLTRIVPNEQITDYEAKQDKKFTAGTILDQNYYQVTFEGLTSTQSKGQGHLYEATLEHDESFIAAFSKSYKLVSDIIRIEKSLNRNQCSIEDRDVLKYCSCIQKSDL